MLPILIFIAFVTVPMIEIGLFIQVGGWIGLWPTLFTVVLTAIMGTALLRQQGTKVLMEAQETINQGSIPVEQAIHGVFLLVSGLLLLTPGFMTDAIGFLLFVPPFRLWLGRRIFEWVKNNSNVTVYKSDGFSETFQSSFHTDQPHFTEDDAFSPKDTPDNRGDNVIDLETAAFRAETQSGTPNPNSPWTKAPGSKAPGADGSNAGGPNADNSDQNR